MMFIRSQYKIETGEAERIAVDHVAHATNADAAEGSTCEFFCIVFGNGAMCCYLCLICVYVGASDCSSCQSTQRNQNVAFSDRDIVSVHARCGKW